MGKTVHNNYITIAKAIGIILMVVGHSGCPNVLFRLIYLFHMPLFFFCSGIFMRNLIGKNDIYLFLKKRVVGLYIPFVKWSVLFLLLHNLFMQLGVYNVFFGFEGGSSSYTMKDIVLKLFFIVFTMHDYEELLGGFWFIRTLFVSSLLIALFSSLLRDKLLYRHYIICLMFFIFTILIRRFAPETELWRDISMGAFGAFFYMLGNIAMYYTHYWQNKYCCVVGSILLFASFLYFREGVSMACGYNKVFPFSIGAIGGILFVVYLSMIIDAKVAFLKPALYYIGNHTLEILALHFLAFRLVSFCLVLWYRIDYIHIAEHPVINKVDISHSYWWLLYCIIGIITPLIIDWIWQKFVKKIKFKKVFRNEFYDYHSS